MLDTAFTHEAVPWGWAEVLCLCETPETPSRIQIAEGVTNKNCLKCGKRLRWAFLMCKGCGNRYDYLFRHHANMSGEWAKHKQLCWTCITAKDPAQDNVTYPDGSILSDYPPDFLGVPREPRSMDEILADDDDVDSLLNFEL